MNSLQAVIVNNIIPSLQSEDLLALNNALQKELVSRVRNSLHVANEDKSFQMEINAIQSYNSFGLLPHVIDFIEHFDVENLNPLFIEIPLPAVIRGEGMIVLTLNGLSDIWIYVYPEKNAIFMFNDVTNLIAISGNLEIRGVEDHVPFLTFLIKNIKNFIKLPKLPDASIITV